MAEGDRARASALPDVSPPRQQALQPKRPDGIALARFCLHHVLDDFAPFYASMTKRITLIQGHPDSDSRHFGHALADEYANGARDGCYDVRKVDVGELDFPLLRTKQDFEKGALPVGLEQAVEAIKWANHLVIIYPLWLGSMPALLKGFFEQVFRPGVAFEYQPNGKMPRKLFAGKTARVIVTMGMPAFLYRWFFFAHSLKSLKRNILEFCGITPVKATLIGNVEGLRPDQRTTWLDNVRKLGEMSQ